MPGELFFLQLGLSGFALEESALVVGPAGTLVLLDLANDSHVPAPVQAIDEPTPRARRP